MQSRRRVFLYDSLSVHDANVTVAMPVLKVGQSRQCIYQCTFNVESFRGRHAVTLDDMDDFETVRRNLSHTL